MQAPVLRGHSILRVLGTILCWTRRSMTDRERWTVYPLLLLSLAISLRDKIAPPTTLTLRSLQCQQLSVVGAGNKPSVLLGSSGPNMGAVEVYGPSGKPAVAIGSNKQAGGGVELFGQDGEARLVMSAVSGPSNLPVIQLVGADNKPKLALAVTEQNAGRVELVTGTNQPALTLGTDAEGKSGSVVTFGESARPQVILDTAGGYGRVSTFSDQGRLTFTITHDENGVGRALGVDEQGKVYLVTMAPLNVTRPPDQQPEQGQADEAVKSPEEDR